MDKELEALKETAQSLVGWFRLSDNADAGSVAAALKTRKGNVYTGICIDFPSGMGFCAEHSAVAEMLKHRETEIAACVAVSKDGVYAPCGRCRELIAQTHPANLNARFLVENGTTRTLAELLPNHG